jgi:hypothetical protein
MADWKCPHCLNVEIRGIDAPGHEEWSQNYIAAHEATHAEHLDEHQGDVDALHLRLQSPALHAALTSTDERQP